MLEKYIRKKLKEKQILLMTHIVIGYPSLQDSYSIIQTMVDAGVDLIELQIPFSEPIADGPVILQANQHAISNGIRVQDCLEFAKKISGSYQIPFLFMSYYNIIFKYGIEQFVMKMADCNIKGAIIPDLPPEEGKKYLHAMNKRKLAPIFIFSPNSSNKRMKFLASLAQGFLYCVARKGVTGYKTDFSDTLTDYLNRCNSVTNLPLALGFGVKEKSDIEFLTGKAAIAVIGTKIIELINKNRINDIGPFLRSLR